MKPGRQALLGVFMAVLSSLLVLGSFSLSMLESGFALALVPTDTPTHTWTPAPAITLAPGEPTFTATPDLPPTETPTPFIPTPTNCPPPAGWLPLVIEPWHTLDELARTYGSTPGELAQANCLVGETLPAGAIIYVPPLPTPPPAPTRPQPTACVPSQPIGWVLYTIRPGDTLYSLGARFNISYQTLQQVNCISDPSSLKAWTQIWVPYVPVVVPTFTATPFPTIPPTASPTRIPTQPPTSTPTLPPAATATASPSRTPTSTPTGSIVPSDTPTSTPVPTGTPTSTSTPEPTDTPVPTSTHTPVPTDTTNPYPDPPYPDPPYPAPLGGWMDALSDLLSSVRLSARPE